MFDWNDEELTNIIWGEGGESDDHIVPYPDQNEEKTSVLFGDSSRTETNEQKSSISSVEQKKLCIISGNGVELDTSSKYDNSEAATGFGLDSWPNGPNPSTSNAGKGDQGLLDSVDASKTITKNSQIGWLIDETAQFDKDSGMFENPPEDGEQSDFVDYGWANIGSFDDLDRIFSNNDLIFGDISVGNADEQLWSSSKDVTGSPVVPTHLSRGSSDSLLGALNQSEIKAQYTLDTGQSSASGYDNLNEVTSYAPADAQASIDAIEHSGCKSNTLRKEKTCVIGGKIQAGQKQLGNGNATALNEFPNKGHKQKKLRNGQKDKKSEIQQLHNLDDIQTLPGSPLQQVNNQYSSRLVNSCAPLVPTQQTPLQRPEPLQLLDTLYGDMMNHYPAGSVWAHFCPREGSHELGPSGYEVPLTNSENVAAKPPPVTPKEKIEKSRRRQQLREILAIQKQQQQFGNKVSVSELSSMEGGKTEIDDSICSFPSFEPNSPIEQDGSNATSMTFDNLCVEESVLYRLQDPISQMDIRTRLCIRDSLFRLAESAMQRQYPNDTSSVDTRSRDEVLSNKDTVNHENFTRMPDVETDTNPIDRTVAHLLFHRPLEFSGKSAETPDSPPSANIPYERKANLSKILAKRASP